MPLALAATQIAGVAVPDAGTTVMLKLNRSLTLSYCTRGSDRLSPVPRKLFNGNEHSVPPNLFMTCMGRLTVSTIWVGPTAAFTSGGWHPPQPAPWAMPSKFATTPGATNGWAARLDVVLGPVMRCGALVMAGRVPLGRTGSGCAPRRVAVPSGTAAGADGAPAGSRDASTVRAAATPTPATDERRSGLVGAAIAAGLIPTATVDASSPAPRSSMDR